MYDLTRSWEKSVRCHWADQRKLVSFLFYLVCSRALQSKELSANINQFNKAVNSSRTGSVGPEASGSLQPRNLMMRCLNYINYHIA